jgi:hypothetical protein
MRHDSGFLIEAIYVREFAASSIAQVKQPFGLPILGVVAVATFEVGGGQRATEIAIDEAVRRDANDAVAGSEASISYLGE